VIQASGAVEEGRGHSAFYRFFSRASWNPDAIGIKLLGLVMFYAGLVQKVVNLLVDDSLAKKRGPHIFGAGMHHDAPASTYGRGPSGKRHVSFAFGHSWVVLSVHVPLPWNPNRGISLPILFRLYRPKKLTPVEHYVKRTELAREMIEFVLAAFPNRRFRILGDNEYACRTVVRDLPHNATFVGPMPKDAALYELPGSRKRKKRGRKPLKGARLPSLGQIASDQLVPWREVTVNIYGKTVPLEIKTFICLWYTVAGTHPVRVVYTRDPRGRYEERTYFSTDTDRTAKEVVELYSFRWLLECTFRNGKQSLGISDPQNGFWRRSQIPEDSQTVQTDLQSERSERGRKAVLHTFSFGMLTYSFVIIWYLMNGNPEKDIEAARERAPWYRHKSSVSFDDMLLAIRIRCLEAKLSHHPKFANVPKELWGQLATYCMAA